MELNSLERISSDDNNHTKGDPAYRPTCCRGDKKNSFLFFVIIKTNKNRFNNNFLFFVRNNEIFFIISQYRANVRIDTGFVCSFNGFDFEN